MATSKTLTPTNVTIQIPEFTDQPDQRVNSNCLDKEADAINALNTHIVNDVFTKSPKSIAFTGDLNNVNLIGYYFGQGSSMSNAPYSTSTYYAILAFGRMQLAFAHSADGSVRLYQRHYINDKWYAWRYVDLSAIPT